MTLSLLTQLKILQPVITIETASIACPHCLSVQIVGVFFFPVLFHAFLSIACDVHHEWRTLLLNLISSTQRGGSEPGTGSYHIGFHSSSFLRDRKGYCNENKTDSARGLGVTVDTPLRGVLRRSGSLLCQGCGGAVSIQAGAAGPQWSACVMDGGQRLLPVECKSPFSFLHAMFTTRPRTLVTYTSSLQFVKP